MIAVSHIVGLTLTSASASPQPLVFALLNFTGAVQNGTPQRYEWTSSDGWTTVSTDPFTSHRYSQPGHHWMTVNASDELGYRLARVSFTVHRLTEARVTYAQVPPTAVIGQTFVLAVFVEANTDSLLRCSLFLDEELIGNASGGDAVARSRGRCVVSLAFQVFLDVGGKHRVTLVLEDVAAGERSTFFWQIDAFDAITDVAVDLPTPAVATGSTVAFTARRTGGSGTITYRWDFGDQSAPVDTGVSPQSAAHTYTRPGTYRVRATASNNVSRVTGAASLSVVDVISGVMLAYDGPTALGDDTFVKAVVDAGTEVTFNFSAIGSTVIAKSEDAVMVRYFDGGLYEVTVLAQNAVSSGSASLTVYVVDASTLEVLGVSNATCGLPLSSVVTFHADVVCASTSDVVFHWSIPDALDYTGRGLSTASAYFAEPGIFELTLVVWNDAVGARRVYRRQLCANETVPEESYDPKHSSIGISSFGAPYLPAERHVTFFPIVSHCSFICSFYWQFSDTIPPTETQGSKVGHAFRTPGMFNISLAIRRRFVQKTTIIVVVVQKMLSRTALQAAVEASSADEPIEFIVTTKPDENEAGNLTYRWSFDDNPNASYVGSASRMTYAFHSEGIHYARVTVYNNVSQVTAITSVNVCGKITGLTFTGCCGHVFNNSIVFEVSVKSGQTNSYHWTLRDDEGVALVVSTAPHFAYTFASAGRYQIQLTATNPLRNQTVVDYFDVQVNCMTSTSRCCGCY